MDAKKTKQELETIEQQLKLITSNFEAMKDMENLSASDKALFLRRMMTCLGPLESTLENAHEGVLEEDIWEEIEASYKEKGKIGAILSHRKGFGSSLLDAKKSIEEKAFKNGWVNS